MERNRNIHIFQRSPRLRSRVHVEWNENLRLGTHVIFLKSCDDNRGNNGRNNHNYNHDCQDETRTLRLKTCPLAHVFFGVRHIGYRKKDEMKKVGSRALPVTYEQEGSQDGWPTKKQKYTSKELAGQHDLRLSVSPVKDGPVASTICRNGLG